MKIKHCFRDSRANLDTGSFAYKHGDYKDFREMGLFALDVATRRVQEVVRMTVDGEPIGPQRRREYMFSAAYYAWRAMEDATTYLRLASETSDDKEFVSNTDEFFEFSSSFFHLVVEDPFLQEWQKRSSPAFRYAEALKKGDKSKADKASRIIANVSAKFCEIALRFAPENDAFNKTFRYCQAMSAPIYEF